MSDERADELRDLHTEINRLTNGIDDYRSENQRLRLALESVQDKLGVMDDDLYCMRNNLLKVSTIVTEVLE